MESNIEFQSLVDKIKRDNGVEDEVAVFLGDMVMQYTKLVVDQMIKNQKGRYIQTNDLVGALKELGMETLSQQVYSHLMEIRRKEKEVIMKRLKDSGIGSSDMYLQFSRALLGADDTSSPEIGAEDDPV